MLYCINKKAFEYSSDLKIFSVLYYIAAILYSMNSEMDLVNEELKEKEHIFGITEDNVVLKYTIKPFVNYGLKPIGKYIIKPVSNGFKKVLNGASVLCGTTSVFVIHD